MLSRAVLRITGLLALVLPTHGLLRVLSSNTSSGVLIRAQLPSHDLYGCENSIASVQAVMISARFDAQRTCQLAFDALPQRLNSTAIGATNATLLFVHWTEAAKAGCHSFNQVG